MAPRQHARRFSQNRTWGVALALGVLSLSILVPWLPNGAGVAQAQDRPIDVAQQRGTDPRATSTPERRPAGNETDGTTVDSDNIPEVAPTSTTESIDSGRIPEVAPTSTPVTVDGDTIPEVAPTSTPVPIDGGDIPEVAPTSTEEPWGTPVDDEIGWDLRAARIEVYQSVTAREGSTDTEVPLVARKETLVRVYVELTGTQSSQGASVHLQSFRKGQEVGNCDSWLFDTYQAFTPGGLGNPILALLFRDDLSRTVNYTYTMGCDTLAEGDVTFRATVAGAECAACGGNNVVETTVTFSKVRALKVKPYLVTITRLGSPNFGKSPQWTTQGMEYVVSQFPITAVDVKSPGTILTDINVDRYGGHDPGTADDPNTNLDDLARKFWWDDFFTFLVAFHDDFGSSAVDLNVALFHGDVTGCWGISAWYYNSTAIGCGGTYAHEWGHSLGLPHASDFHGECAGGSCDPTWDYPHGGIANHGWDALSPLKLILPDAVDSNGDPWHSHDTMSYGGCTKASPGDGTSEPWYCGNWLSVKNYAHIAQKLRCANPQHVIGNVESACFIGQAPFAQLASAPQDVWLAEQVLQDGAAFLLKTASDVTGLPLDGRGSAETEGEGEYLLVSGQIEEDGSAIFKPFWGLTLPAGSYDYTGEGSLRLELLGADGSVLFERYFEPFAIQAHIHTHRAFIDEHVPALPETSLIRLWRGDMLLAERRVSPAVPHVRLLTPNGGESLPDKGEVAVEWEAGDEDGDALRYWLQYSADNGESWETVRRNLTETRYSLDLSQVPGGEQALLRVIATDGANSAQDDSDRPFTVGAKAPFVEITSRDESAVQGGEGLLLTGVGIDLEDGMLNGELLQWTSNLDGALGPGEQLIARRLSVGMHIITLVATDSDGQQSLATRTIQVVPAS